VRYRHGLDEVLLEHRLNGRLDLLDLAEPPVSISSRPSVLSSAMRAPVPAALPAE
jgi:hypothetical protein